MAGVAQGITVFNLMYMLGAPAFAILLARKPAKLVLIAALAIFAVGNLLVLAPHLAVGDIGQLGRAEPGVRALHAHEVVLVVGGELVGAHDRAVLPRSDLVGHPRGHQPAPLDRAPRVHASALKKRCCVTSGVNPSRS